MTHLIVRRAAERDITSAFGWYQEQAVGLGHEFLRSLDACLASLRRRPRSYPFVHKEVRRALLRRFPYAVFYLAEPERIVVLAVFHVRRDPERWKQRV